MATAMPWQAVRPDEDDRQTAIDGDRRDRGEDRRDRVLAGVEPAGKHGDQGMRGEPDGEIGKRRRDQVQVGLGDLAAAEQDLDDWLARRSRSAR